MEQKTKHSPGPWRKRLFHDKWEGWIEDAQGNPVIQYAGCGSHEASWNNPKDIDLVFAAPEMLEALKESTLMLDYLEKYAREQRNKILYNEEKLGFLGLDMLDDFIIRKQRNKELIAKAEGMEVPTDQTDVDPTTGEITPVFKRVLPTHFRSPSDGVLMPIEDPEVWIYHEGVSE
jgi:hypothetical protein